MERIDAIEGKEIRRIEGSGACNTAEDFFAMTRKEYASGPVKEYDGDDVIRFIGKIVIKYKTVEVVFKAGVSVTVERQA